MLRRSCWRTSSGCWAVKKETTSAALHVRLSRSLLVSQQRQECRLFSSYPPHEVVGLPALSPTMTHGNLASWKLKEGSPISAGDVICEVETDKAVVDFEAQDDMFLAKILVPEGSQDIQVGQPIMITVLEEEDVAAFANYVLKATSTPVHQLMKEAIPPSKNEVPVDPQTKSPVAPGDFLVNAQTVIPTQKASTLPVSVPPSSTIMLSSTKVSTAAAAAVGTSWGKGAANGRISASMRKAQEDYIKKYGVTGTVPLSEN